MVREKNSFYTHESTLLHSIHIVYRFRERIVFLKYTYILAWLVSQSSKIS